MRRLLLGWGAMFLAFAGMAGEAKKASSKDKDKEAVIAAQEKIAEAEARDKEKEKTALAGCKVLMIIAPEGYRDEELNVPKKICEAHGATVEVASTSRHECRGMRGGSVYPDVELAKVNLADYLVVVLVGGIGAKTFFNDKPFHEFLAGAADDTHVLGAICLAPVVLAKAGLLKGKKATVWDDAQKNNSRALKDAGATYVAEDVVVDGDLVTANGPEAAENFARKLVEIAKKKKAVLPKAGAGEGDKPAKK